MNNFFFPKSSKQTIDYHKLKIGNMSLIFISGVSGAGKTTVAKLLAHLAKRRGINVKHIDQDDFYKTSKPPVKLSNNSTTSNWDCVEAIEWDALNQTLTIARGQNQLTILSGFALWDDLIVEKPDAHYLIVYCKDDELSLQNELPARILESRRVAKKLNKRQARRDELMVREVVWPFYLETLQHLGPHTVMERKNAESMALSILREYQS